MAYHAVFGIQVHAGDEIIVARLNGIPDPLVSRSIAAFSAVFATQLSRAEGLLSAPAGTTPALAAKYPAPVCTGSVKIMPARKLTIAFIALDVRPQQLI
jgi:hypothetical protein